MRVLIVDDDRGKVQLLAGRLVEFGVEVSDIETADCCQGALSRAEGIAFDLAIIDVILPTSVDADPVADGGIGLIRAFSRQSAGTRPRWLAAVTASTEDPGLERRLASLGAVLLRFSPVDSEWSDGLASLVGSVKASLNPAVGEFGVLACVVCALKSPEADAVVELPWSWKEADPPPLTGDHGAYREGALPGTRPTGNLSRVICATASRMGVAATTALATRLAIAYRPRLLVMVGITAGIRTECGIGDVICADPVFEWGVGKWTTSGGNASFEPRMYQYPLDPRLRNLVGSVEPFEEEFVRIYRARDGARPDRPAKMLRGVVATGPSVVAASNINEYIRGHHPKVLGIDMEAYGIFQAADEAPKPLPRALVMKSVVDFADERKGDAHQAYAARCAAGALSVLLQRFVITPNCW